jgi:hypothetical protein
MKNIVRCLVPFACLVAVAGCNRDRRERVDVDRDRPSDYPSLGSESNKDKSGTTTVTGANITSNESAVNRIVAARCAREQSCNNVGADKRFSSHDVCVQKVRADMKDDLNAKDCPKGIDQKELNECLEAIQKESCNNPIDTIGRLTACRTSDMCLSVDSKNR